MKFSYHYSLIMNECNLMYDMSKFLRLLAMLVMDLNSALITNKAISTCQEYYYKRSTLATQVDVGTRLCTITKTLL